MERVDSKVVLTYGKKFLLQSQNFLCYLLNCTRSKNHLNSNSASCKSQTLSLSPHRTAGNKSGLNCKLRRKLCLPLSLKKLCLASSFAGLTNWLTARPKKQKKEKNKSKTPQCGQLLATPPVGCLGPRTMSTGDASVEKIKQNSSLQVDKFYYQIF